jgi:hypothetical protein
MPKLRQSEIFRGLLVFALAAGAMGNTCNGVPENKAFEKCDPAVAEISIYDGRIQKVCGCGGVDGEFATQGTPLNCTFALGKTVFVNYIGPFLQHQFIAVGTPVLPDGPVFDPSSASPRRSHAFTPEAVGTYGFEDQFDHTITGQIVVTP